MTALGAMLRQARIDRGLGLRDASASVGMSAVLFSQIESGTEKAPQEGLPADSLAEFMGIDTGTYYGLSVQHNQKSPELKAERAAHFEKVMTARKSIIETKKTSGTITCPVCGKQLRFRVHSNGHVHAACETIDCLAWLE